MSLKYQTDDEAQTTQDGEASGHVANTRPPYYTYILIGSIVAVALVQLVTGLDASIEIAGFDKRAFANNREFWRILTGAATHGSVMHVAMNCYAFYGFGHIIEMISNRAHLAMVFLLSAIGGGVLSLIFLPDGLSVGASGGIVGLVGYLVVYAFRRRQFISPEFRKSLLINIGFILIFGLVLYKVIDNFAHIGGLVTGVVYGLLQIPADEYTDPREVGPVADVAGVTAVGVYIATCVFSILVILRIV